MRQLANFCWYRRSPLCLLLLPLAAVYGAIIRLRRWAYRFGLVSVWRAPLPVIVVGNLTVGGTGKSPLVIWLTQQMQQKGIRVGVVSRGYGARLHAAATLVTVTSDAAEVGDEPLMILLRTAAPVAVARQRKLAVQELLRHHQLDLIIADDGLQHYGLARDFELLVIDGQRHFGNGLLLPAGPLREWVGRLKEADALVVNGGACNSDDLAGALAMELKFSSAVNLVSGELKVVAGLQDGVAIAGIGNPERFFNLLRTAGVRLQECVPFADHQPYRLEDLASLTTGAQPLLMTEKDAVKCRRFAKPNWWYLPVEVEFADGVGEALFEKILRRVSDGSGTARTSDLP